MNQRQMQQTSNGRRQHQGHGKTARPNLHRRVHSYQNAHSQSQIVSKLTIASAKKAAKEESSVTDDESDGMAGLPQFCTTCERQIIHPSKSTLYCSRSCQRRDSAKPAPTDPLVSPAIAYAPSYFDVPQPDILPQRSPTVLRPLSMTFSDLYLSDCGSPTEDSNPYEEEHRRSKRLSDATKYYSHTENDDSNYSLARRPQFNRSSTTTLPSLSHTPSSSVGTAASFSSYRPLPIRHDPMTAHRSIKSADLVIPTFAGPPPPTMTVENASAKSEASTLTSFYAAEADNAASAKHDGEKQSPAKGSLRQLVGHCGPSGTPER